MMVKFMILICVPAEVTARMDRFGSLVNASAILEVTSLTIIVKFVQWKGLMILQLNNAKKFAKNNINILIMVSVNAKEVIKEDHQEIVSLKNAQKIVSTIQLMIHVSAIKVSFFPQKLDNVKKFQHAPQILNIFQVIALVILDGLCMLINLLV